MIRGFLVLALTISIAASGCKHLPEKTIESSNILSFRVIESNELVSVHIGEGPKSYIVLRIEDGDSIHEYPIDRENSWNYFKYSYYMRGGGVLNDALDLNYLTYEDDTLKIKISEEYSNNEDGEKNTLTLTTENKGTGEVTEQVGDIDSKEGSLIDIRDNENIITIPYQESTASEILGQTPKVRGEIAIAAHEKTNVDLAYFKQLQKGAKYDDIVKEIGEPTGTVGFGLIRPYYAVQDVYVVMDFSYTQDGEYDRLLGMEVCNENEELYGLQLK